jgi:hypothetical protein
MFEGVSPHGLRKDSTNLANHHCYGSGPVYFTIVDGSTVVLDQPTDLGGELHYFATGTGTATLELWLTSCGGAY